MVTSAVPTVLRSEVGTVAFRLVLLMKVVGRALPFQRTTEVETRFCPVTLIVADGPPTVRLSGDAWPNTGASEPTTWNVEKFEVPPPGAGLITFTLEGPGCSRSLAGMVAINSVGLTNVVGSAAPFQYTAEFEMKLLPLTSSIRVGPLMSAEDGESEVIAGTGLPPGVSSNSATIVSRLPAFCGCTALIAGNVAELVAPAM